MTVYVDDMYLLPMGQFRRMKMSHMIADTEDELHAMAAKLGIIRRWYQGDHYDVSMGVREKAIDTHGVVPITTKQLSAMAYFQRRKLPMGDPATAVERMRAEKQRAGVA